MANDVTTGLYPFDPTGESPDNFVQREKRTLIAPDDYDYIFFIPSAAPFFVESFTLRDDATKQELVEGKDFVFGHWFVEASNSIGKVVAGSVRMLDRNRRGIVEYDYQTLGGNWGFDDEAITEELANKLVNPLVRSWEQISDLPATFPPIDHEQHVDDLIGFEEVVDTLGRLVEAIEAGNDGALPAHLADYDNPHKVTKTQVGLSNVQNYKLATSAEAQAGTVNIAYMTPYLTKLQLDALALAPLNAHIDDHANPHNVTKSQVGLGNVPNYAMASSIQSVDASRNDLFISPQGMAAYVDSRLQGDDGNGIEAHIADRENPHAVTAVQVGLGNVANYPMANNNEAVDRDNTQTYMSPYTTTLAIEDQIGQPFRAHLIDTDNPHEVTKAQVGLGDVQNFSMATETEATEGSVTLAYMSPYLTALAIEGQAGATLRTHVDNTDNPHNVTSSQVGLGNVPNFAKATETQAVDSSNDSTLMTPHTVSLAIAALASGTLEGHISDTGNPHQVTKSQVGLSNVPNYAMASETQAVDAGVTTAFMSPSGVALAVENQVGARLTAHIDDQDNPHGITLAQLGGVTEATLNNALLDYLPVESTAADADLVFGQDKAGLTADILSGTAADSELLGGVSLGEIRQEFTLSAGRVWFYRPTDGNTYYHLLDIDYTPIVDEENGINSETFIPLTMFMSGFIDSDQPNTTVIVRCPKTIGEPTVTVIDGVGEVVKLYMQQADNVLSIWAAYSSNQGDLSAVILSDPTNPQLTFYSNTETASSASGLTALDVVSPDEDMANAYDEAANELTAS